MQLLCVTYFPATYFGEFQMNGQIILVGVDQTCFIRSHIQFYINKQESANRKNFATSMTESQKLLRCVRVPGKNNKSMNIQRPQYCRQIELWKLMMKINILTYKFGCIKCLFTLSKKFRTQHEIGKRNAETFPSIYLRESCRLCKDTYTKFLSKDIRKIPATKTNVQY